MVNLVIGQAKKIMTRPSYSTGLSETYNMISSFCVCALLCGTVEITASISWYVCVNCFSYLWVNLSGKVKSLSNGLLARIVLHTF